MSAELFVTVLGAVLTFVLTTAFRHLPGARWQVFATIPLHPDGKGGWSGLNLTYYGLLLAAAGLTGTAMCFVLLAAIGLSVTAVLMLIALLLTVGVPAARWMARLVEGKKHTFTVAGSALVGLLLTPAAVMVTNRALHLEIRTIPVLGALCVAYLFGEGLGRLGCISFGCCYGRRVDSLQGVLRRIFDRWHFVFTGPTKKIAYASGLEHVPVVPVQALTAALYSGLGLIGTWLFLRGYYGAALLLAAAGSQVWRTLSETLRADYRGGGRFSAYQAMGAVNVLFVLALLLLWPEPPAPAADPVDGLRFLVRAPVALFLQGVFVLLFLYFGCSRVTGANLAFYIHRQRI